MCRNTTVNTVYRNFGSLPMNVQRYTLSQIIPSYFLFFGVLFFFIFYFILFFLNSNYKFHPKLLVIRQRL